MGIDWEEILGAEGADMAEAYNDSLPEEPYEPHEPTRDYNYDSLEDEEEPVDDFIGEPEDGPYAMTRDELIDECLHCYEWMYTLRYDVDLARQDIKTLMDLLGEHGIQVPEDIEKNWTLEDDDMEVSAEEPVKVEDDEEAKRQALEEAKRQAILEQCKIREQNMIGLSIPFDELEEFEDFDE